MNTMPDPTCPNCGQECEVALHDGYLLFICVPCRTRDRAQELEKLAAWNAWARGEAALSPAASDGSGE